MQARAKAMLRIANILDDLAAEDQRVLAFDIYRTYGGPTDEIRAYERQRKADQRDLDAVVSGTTDTDSPGHLSGTNSHGESSPPHPIVVTPGSSSSPKLEKKLRSKTEKTLEPKDLDKAKALLRAEDFEFLQACPEPFRTQWLADGGDWWVSLTDGYPKIRAAVQASRYMAWEGARRKRDHRAALRNWIAKADRWREADEMRQAVRR